MAISLPADANRFRMLGGTSSADGVTPTTVFVDPVTHRLYVNVTNSSGIQLGASTPLASPAASMTLGSLVTTGYGFLQVDIIIEGFQTADVPLVTFNADSGANYAYSGINPGAVIGTNPYSASGAFGVEPLGTGTANSTLKSYVSFRVQNVATESKLLSGTGFTATQSFATFGGSWSNTSSTITAVTVAGVGGFSLSTGSYIKIYGAQ